MTMLLAPSKAVLAGEEDKASDERQEKALDEHTSDEQTSDEQTSDEPASDGRRATASAEQEAAAVAADSTPNGAGEAAEEPFEETAASGARGSRSRGAAA